MPWKPRACTLAALSIVVLAAPPSVAAVDAGLEDAMPTQVCEAFSGDLWEWQIGNPVGIFLRNLDWEAVKCTNGSAYVCDGLTYAIGGDRAVGSFHIFFLDPSVWAMKGEVLGIPWESSSRFSGPGPRCESNDMFVHGWVPVELVQVIEVTGFATS